MSQTVQSPSLEPESKRRKTDTESKESSPSFHNCSHWFVYNGICVSCDSTVDNFEGRSFHYRDPVMQMSDEAITFTKRAISHTSWVDEKKLHLILDLDHTLIHTARVLQLPEAEKYLAEEAESRSDLWRFNVGQPDEALIKLRPFVHQFLKECNEMFYMYVYTKGTYGYARLVLSLIDPDKVYFGKRIITKRESPGKKTLDLVLADERGIVIIDDKRSVWPGHGRNLLQIAKYKYFKSNVNDVLEGNEKRDESDEYGPLASVLSYLKDVHKSFFSDSLKEDLDSMDVRLLLRQLWKAKC